LEFLHRIRFDGLVPVEERAAIATVLVPLADAGYEVTVESPDADRGPLGWRVRLDALGQHRSFRIPAGGTLTEWAAAVVAALRRQTT
jgi:hypothetical protein